YQNKNGQPFDVYHTIFPCAGVTSPTNCVDTTIDLTHYGDHWTLKHDNVAIGGGSVRPAFDRYDIFMIPGFELSVVTALTLYAYLPDGHDAASVEMNFVDTAQIFVDSADPLDPLISDDGHDYSDPEGRKAELVVKSNTFNFGNGKTLLADPNYKMVGGGVELPAGSGCRLVSLTGTDFPTAGLPQSAWPTG